MTTPSPNPFAASAEQVAALQKQFEPLLDTMKQWTSAWQAAAQGVSAGQAAPDPHQLLDQNFEFAKKMLELQHQISRQALEATLSTTKAKG